MCPQELEIACPILSPQTRQGLFSLRILAGILFIFVFSLALATAFAENRSEEYLSVKNWTMPENAMPLHNLIEGEIITDTAGKPFSGIAYEKYPNGRLLRAMDLKDGEKNGLLLLWYPDGAPQMSAVYRDGILNGRFLGWYANGSVIYDLMLNNGTFAGDVLLDDDDSRTSSETIDSEREGPDNDQSPE